MDKQPSRLFLIWSKSRGHYTGLRSHLVKDNWTVLVIQDLVNLSSLSAGEDNLVCLAILRPAAKLTNDEIKAVKNFVEHGHSALIASSSPDDDDESLSTSAVLNELTSAYGVRYNDDCVIRPNMYKLYHPQQAMIEDFVVNRGLMDVLKAQIEHKPSEDSLSKVVDGPIKLDPRIIYPIGCTMRVDIKLSTIVMTTSKWSIPTGQPIGAFYRADSNADSRSRIVFLGSAHLMADRYLAKEDNLSLVNCFIDFMTNKNFPINISDARTIEIAENNLTPELDRLSQIPIGCLKGLEPLPEDKTELIDRRLFNIDNNQLPNIMKAYRDFGIPHEPLTLMGPILNWGTDEKDLTFLLKRLT